MSIEETAQAMYEALPTSKPSWFQLGDITRSVWLERAQAQAQTAATEKTVNETAALPAPNEAGSSLSLFGD